MLLACCPGPAGEQERERHADRGQHDDGQEGGLEALVEDDERVRAFVRRQVVRGAGDGDRGGDGDAERAADLQGGVAQARGEPGLVLGDTGERRDGGGHEGEADPGTGDEQPEEDVCEVAAADGDLGEQQRARAHERHAGRGDRPEAELEDRGLGDDRADRDRDREHDRADPELEGRVAEHLLGVEREHERHGDRDGAGEEHHEVRGDERARAQEAQRHERRRWRDSISAKAARSTAETANSRIVRASPQPASGASTSA